MGNLKSLLEEFQEKRRKQDNDLFYYINTMVEVDNILFDLRTRLEDAKKENKGEEVKKLELELEDYQNDYQEYVAECQRILQDMKLSEISSYEEVEGKQNSLEWERVNFILMLLTEYHDVLSSVNKSDDNYEETFNELNRIASMINGKYRRLFASKNIEEYNKNLFGEPKKLIEEVVIPSFKKTEKVILDENNREGLDIDRVLELQEQRLKDQDNFIESSLPHIVSDKQDDWRVYLSDYYHQSRGKELLSYMEKLENGYSFESLREDLKHVEHGDEIALGLAKYSKEYQKQELEYQKMVEEKIQTKFEPTIKEEEFSYPSFLPKEENAVSREVWPELRGVQRTSKDVVSELFFYIHKLDVKRGNKTNLGKVIELTHIDMDELSSLDFEKKSNLETQEEMLDKIQELLSEYKNLTGKDVDTIKAYEIISGVSLTQEVSEEKENKKKFVWLRKASDKLKKKIKEHKKALLAVAFAGLVVGGLVQGKMMNKNNVSTKVSIENTVTNPLDNEEEIAPLILEDEKEIIENSKPTIEITSETKSPEVKIDTMKIHIGDQVQLKDNALIYRTEYLNTNFGGDMQGRIPSYQRDLVRGIEGIGFRMHDGTVKLVYDQGVAQELYNQGNKIESVLTFDGFYGINDALVVEANMKGMSL